MMKPMAKARVAQTNTEEEEPSLLRETVHRLRRAMEEDGAEEAPELLAAWRLIEEYRQRAQSKKEEPMTQRRPTEPEGQGEPGDLSDASMTTEKSYELPEAEGKDSDHELAAQLQQMEKMMQGLKAQVERKKKEGAHCRRCSLSSPCRPRSP